MKLHDLSYMILLEVRDEIVVLNLLRVASGILWVFCVSIFNQQNSISNNWSLCENVSYFENSLNVI